MKKIVITLLIFILFEGILIALAAFCNFKIPILLLSIIPFIYLWLAFKKSSKKEE